MPDQPPRRRPDLLGPLGLVVILGVMAGGYLLFPWLLRVFSYQNCIASGHITGC